MEHRGIKVRKEGSSFSTTGLSNYIGKELTVSRSKRSDEEYLKLLAYLIDYICQPGVVIKPNQTIAYHSWSLKFVENGGNVYELWEAEQFGNDYCIGVDYSIIVVNQQLDECYKQNASPIFPTFGQNIVVSKGVYEGLPVEAVRYPSPSHMCGWWLVTDEYDDDVKSLMNVHYYHVAFKRPDILKYLALPFAYRFVVDAYKFEAWFDEKIKNRHEDRK